MEFREQTLENGLQVVAECNPAAYSTAIAFLVNTGSRDENADIWGVSHFLEHMVFKGTASRSAADVNRELDELGSHSNAFTSEEQTVYYATVLPELTGRAVELLSDIMRPSLRDEDFGIEKQVILEEIAKYEDQPPYGAHEKCMAVHFGDHPLARSVLGTTASVTALSRTQMQSYFDERYSPGNIVLATAGNVDFDRFVDQAREHCGEWQRVSVNRDTTLATGRGGLQVIHKPSSVQQYIVQTSDSPAVEDDDRYAARLLATIVGDDSGSRLFWELVDTGLAEYASVGSYEFHGSGILMTFLCCSPEDAAANLARMAEIEAVVEHDGVTEAELTRAKSKVCSQIILQSERPTNRMFSVGGNWLTRREYATVRELVDFYQAVTCADISAYLERFPLSNKTTVAVGPLESLSLPN
jgi:predicted Zn-dependent peptidase